MYASLSSLVTIPILVHHVTRCSYSPGPLSQPLHTKTRWDATLKKLAISFKELLANPDTGILSLTLHWELLLLEYSAPHKAVLHCFLQVYACISIFTGPDT